MGKKLILIICFFSIITGLLLKAEEKSDIPVSFGLYGGVNFNFHSPSFYYRDNIGNYLEFSKSVSSTGLNLGLISLFPINNKFIFSARLGYNSLNSYFEEYHTIDSLYPDALSSPLINIGTNQYMRATISYIEVAPVLQLHNILPVKNLYFLAGLEIGIPVQMRYNLNYSAGNFSFNVADNAPIPEAKVRTAFIIGAGYMLKLSPSVYLTPEFSYRIPTNNVSGSRILNKWDVTQIRAGINLTFGLSQKKEEPVIQRRKVDLSVRIKDVRHIDSQGRPSDVQSIKVEDVQYSELFPLIPYVFIPEQKSTPAEETQILVEKSEAGEFSILKLEPSALKINKSTLDIIGKRLKENPGSEITITGTIDSKSETRALALERAEFGKKYLMDNYKINEARINIRSTSNPEKPSATSVPEGVEENRRIEFSSSNPKILEPIVLENENQRIADPNQIEFLPEVVSSDTSLSWKMEISQGDKILRKNTGLGYPPVILQWGIQPNELTNKQIPVDYVLTATNSEGMSKSASGSIPVEYLSSARKKYDDMPDKTLSKFSLILFDFDKADVSPSDMKIIDKYIIPAIKFNSTIKIYGYTDKIGDENYNRKLAERRAMAVKEAISSKVNNENIEVYGVGEDAQIFENDSPIGRQLSRTVQVHVVTPK